MINIESIIYGDSYKVTKSDRGIASILPIKFFQKNFKNYEFTQIEILFCINLPKFALGEFR